MTFLVCVCQVVYLFNSFNAIYLHSASQLQVFTVFLHILLLIVVFVAHQNSFISPCCISVLVCCALCYCWVVFHVCLAVGLCVSRGRFNVLVLVKCSSALKPCRLGGIRVASLYVGCGLLCQHAAWALLSAC